MSPDIWLLILSFVLGLVLTWFAMVRSFTREVGGPVAAPPTGTTTTYRTQPLPPREGEVRDDPGVEETGRF